MRVNVCTMLKEELHNSSVAICRRQKQRQIVNSFHICAVLDEQQHNLQVAAC